jgi:tetratricopeptide (TPR) repeat protein
MRLSHLAVLTACIAVSAPAQNATDVLKAATVLYRDPSSLAEPRCEYVFVLVHWLDSITDVVGKPVPFDRMAKAASVALAARDYAAAKEPVRIMIEAVEPVWEAAGLNEGYPARWRAEAAKLNLLSLDFEAARRELRTLLDRTARVKEPALFSDARYSASVDLARAWVMSGEYAQGLSALARAKKEIGADCGIGLVRAEEHREMLRAVWSAAGRANAELELLRIVDNSSETKPGSPRDPWTIEQARRESALLLGNLYLRRGDRTMAIKAYSVVVTRAPATELAEIARAHLRNLEG